VKKFSSPFRLAENDVFVTTSIGIVLSSLGHDQPEDVLRDADIAMYAAKAQGKGIFQVFNPVMRERILRRVGLEADLRQALVSKQMRIHYQPIISLKTGELLALEALARWQHPERGLISPLEFIPLAQETGLIITLDQWMLTEASRQVHTWQTRYRFDPPLKLNLNVAHSLFTQTGLVKRIEAILKDTGLDKQNLQLEITENALVEHNGPMSGIITELSKMGIEVNIDDFGTGYSSLIHLQKLPVFALKIDHTFIQQLRQVSGNTEIVRTIIDLAHDLKLTVFAEGIETQEQLDQLKAMDCDCGQGFLFSHPLDPEATEVLLEKGEAERIRWKQLLTGEA
jgi:EAL domain-containing protein (putative c-di-GMP-specific phosphodiesterase class I)